MNVLTRALAGLERQTLRLWQGLDSRAVLRAAMVLVPLLAGFISMRVGQDSNWDLRNYHWYNPFAFLNGKIGFDHAPGQFQSYFNPTIDLLYYGLATHLPGRVTAFIMGLLHGLNFVVLLALVRQVLRPGEPGEPSAQGTAPWRLPLLLALAGCTGFAFLTQLGNTMGDNLTSITVLGALLLLLRRWPQLLAGGLRGALAASGAGLLIGLGTGLKLTNASYALALCLALLTLNGSLFLRLRTSFVFGLGTLAGIGISAGHWYWKMWTVFGNPLYPQFNNIFKSPMAAPIGIADASFLPKSAFEALMFPFIFTFNPRRVIELEMTQILWPIVYLAFGALVLMRLRRSWQPAPASVPSPAAAPGARLVLVFFTLSYLLWIKLFGIYRYLVPLELLVPLVLWLLLHRLCDARMARVIGAWCLVLGVLANVPRVGWGHDDHGERSFNVEVPVLADPAQSLVFTVFPDPPMGWLVPQFPASLAFVALSSGFPEPDNFRARIDAMLAQRKGPFYLMVSANGLPRGPQPATGRNEEEQAKAVMQITDKGFAFVRPGADIENRNRTLLEAAQVILAKYGLTFREGSCVVYRAGMGGGNEAYQMCEVTRKEGGPVGDAAPAFQRSGG